MKRLLSLLGALLLTVPALAQVPNGGGSNTPVPAPGVSAASPTFTGTVTMPDASAWNSGGANLPSASTLKWNADTILGRAAANVLQMVNGTTPQEFRVQANGTHYGAIKATTANRVGIGTFGDTAIDTMLYSGNAPMWLVTTGGGLVGQGNSNVTLLDMGVTNVGSLTGANAQPMVNLAQTWNTTGVPTLIKANVTNTASGAGSLLMDLQVGGLSKFNVSPSGVISSNGVAGVSCTAGTLNTTTAVVTNGIVTHC